MDVTDESVEPEQEQERREAVAAVAETRARVRRRPAATGGTGERAASGLPTVFAERPRRHVSGYAAPVEDE